MEVQNEEYSSYSLDSFYRVQGEFTLPDGKKIYLRSLSDDEQNIRRKAAVVASRNARKELRDDSTAAYADFVQPVEWAEDDDLTETIVALSQQEFQQDATVQFPRRQIPYPDEANLEEQHEVDDGREKHWLEVIEERRKYVEKRTEDFRKKVQKWTREQRVAKCQELQVGNHAVQAYMEEFFDQLVLLGCFSDKKRSKRQFKNSDVKQLDPRIKDPLLAKLREINELDIFQLQTFSSTAS